LRRNSSGFAGRGRDDFPFCLGGRFPPPPSRAELCDLGPEMRPIAAAPPSPTCPDGQWRATGLLDPLPSSRRRSDQDGADVSESRRARVAHSQAALSQAILPSVLLLDILANVASDTLAGEGLFAALRRQFVEDGRTTPLDVRNALQRRRRQAAALSSRSLKTRSPKVK